MIFSMKKLYITIGMLALGLSFTMIVNAQDVPTTDPADDAANAAIVEQSSYDSSINEGDFEFEISPENPGPHEPVSLKISSNLVDTNRYLITWNVDGVDVQSGIGSRVLVLTTKDYGQAITISVAINLIDSTITKQAILMPQDATTLWEAVDSYAPPFYQGKKLPAYEALVRIISIPNFLGNKQSTATKNAVYNWSRNGNVIPDVSGYGKDSILIQHNRVRPSELIEVTSSATSGSSQAVSSVSIPFFNPKILFYERNITTGIRNILARNTIPLNQKSTSIEAEPYFFSVLNGNPNSLKINWTMNNKPVTLLDARKQTSLTIQKPDGSGNASIGIKAENTNRLFQTAEQKLNVVFIK